jgi:hypothetical protein
MTSVAINARKTLPLQNIIPNEKRFYWKFIRRSDISKDRYGKLTTWRKMC